MIGAQDWFTLISFDAPELIYHLDCKFNRQLSPWTNNDPFKNQFKFQKYNLCHNNMSYTSDNTFIVHLNNGNSTNFADYLMKQKFE